MSRNQCRAQAKKRNLPPALPTALEETKAACPRLAGSTLHEANGKLGDAVDSGWRAPSDDDSLRQPTPRKTERLAAAEGAAEVEDKCRRGRRPGVPGLSRCRSGRLERKTTAQFPTLVQFVEQRSGQDSRRATLPRPLSRRRPADCVLRTNVVGVLLGSYSSRCSPLAAKPPGCASAAAHAT